MDKRRMCPNCRAFISEGDRVCPYCNQPVGQRAIDVRQPGPILGGLISPAHFTTVLILVINLGFYLVTVWLERSMGENIALWALGGKFGPSIWEQHQWWRLVTAGFLHGGLLHIAMNSWVLYDVGAQVEQVYGTPRFLVIYFIGTVVGFYASLLMNPGLSIGASAGITGLIGAMIAFGVVNKSSMGRAIRNFYLRWVVYILAIGFIGGFGTDNWAHIGGLLGGFGIAVIAGTPVHSSRTRESVWRVVAAICLLITAFCLWMVYTHFPTPDQINQLR